MDADTLKSKIDAGCKLYLQPVSLCRNLTDTGPKLGGNAWQSFRLLRLTVRSGDGDISSQIIDLRQLDELLTLPAVSEVFERLISNRADFAGLPMAQPQIMGIVNVTPDSFSDGGDAFGADSALEQAIEMVECGATILDIGGESTRPGADVVSVEHEIARVLPVITAINKWRNGNSVSVRISIDTRNPETMRSAVAAGADIINDVTALEHSANSLSTAADLNTPVCLMHMKGQPKNMQDKPAYSNVVLDVYDYLEQRVLACEAVGMQRSQIAVDVGIGFGKTLEHNLDLLANLSLFHGLGCPILLGASRKSFIEKIVGPTPPKQRLAGSLTALIHGLDQGVQMTRVHDVPQSVQATQVLQNIRYS